MFREKCVPHFLLSVKYPDGTAVRRRNYFLLSPVFCEFVFQENEKTRGENVLRKMTALQAMPHTKRLDLLEPHTYNCVRNCKDRLLIHMDIKTIHTLPNYKS